MKCENCGSALTLQDEFCPYCGALNKPARKHIEDMKRFNKSFEDTRADVLENSRTQSRRHTRLLTLILLVAANVICFAAHAMNYEIRDFYQTTQNKRHLREYQTELASLEESGEYQTLYSLYSYRDLYNLKELREYEAVTTYAGYYNRIVEDVYYIAHPDVVTYNTQGETLQKLANQISYFYQYKQEMDRDYYKERYSKPHLNAILDMEEKMEVLVKTTFGLSEEETESMAEMETQALMYMLGKKVGYYD